MELVSSNTTPPPRCVYVQGDLPGFYGNGNPIQWRVDDMRVLEMMDWVKVERTKGVVWMIVKGKAQIFPFDGAPILEGLSFSVEPVSLLDGDFTVPQEAIRMIYRDLAKVVKRYVAEHYDHYTFDHGGREARIEKDFRFRWTAEEKEASDRAHADELVQMADNTLAALDSDDPIAFANRIHEEHERHIERICRNAGTL